MMHAVFFLLSIWLVSPKCPLWSLQNRGSFSGGRNTRRIVFSALLIFAFPFPVCIGSLFVTGHVNMVEALINFDDDSLHLDILKEALLRAIHDIDATFTKDASNRKLDSGSTATIALIAVGQLMVASIGDSKALLCSERFETPDEARATLVKLYRERRRSPDSSPSREDEKIRVKAAEGYVTEWAGVPLVNGQLAVSRSIGDLSYKSYGVISAPEVMDWQPLAANDSCLVVSSDGIFEKLELQDVCDRLWEVNNQTSSGAGLPSYCSISLADFLVNTAFEKGSMDNMAAVVVPLEPNLVSQSQAREKSISDKTAECALGLQMKNTYALPYGTFGPMPLKQAQPSSTMFNELLVCS